MINEQGQKIISRIENVSSGLRGIAGVLTAMSCAFSNEDDIPSPEYMQAAQTVKQRTASR